MDLKNIIAAIALSAAVIVLYGLFFAPSPEQLSKSNKIQLKTSYNILREHHDVCRFRCRKFRLFVRPINDVALQQNNDHQYCEK